MLFLKFGSRQLLYPLILYKFASGLWKKHGCCCLVIFPGCLKMLFVKERTLFIHFWNKLLRQKCKKKDWYLKITPHHAQKTQFFLWCFFEFYSSKKYLLPLMTNLYNNVVSSDIWWECCYLVSAFKEEITEENARCCPAITKWSGLGVPA